MTPRHLHRLLIAPEIIVVDLAVAALVALERALLVEHPLLVDPPPTDHPPVRRAARDVLQLALHLRRALHGYRAVVRNVLDENEDADLPF